MSDLLILIALLVIAYFTGKCVEKSHYKKIKKREVDLIKRPYLTIAKQIANNKRVVEANLVSASVVIGCDYFRSFLANLRNIFGGNVSTFESLMDRARRESLLRIREKALKMGAGAVVNVKLDSVILDAMQVNAPPKVCVTAYGTALKYAK